MNGISLDNTCSVRLDIIAHYVLSWLWCQVQFTWAESSSRLHQCLDNQLLRCYEVACSQSRSVLLRSSSDQCWPSQWGNCVMPVDTKCNFSSPVPKCKFWNFGIFHVLCSLLSHSKSAQVHNCLLSRFVTGDSQRSQPHKQPGFLLACVAWKIKSLKSSSQRCEKTW